MSPPESSPLSIACLLCGEETPRALHFMLPMLKTYLKREWRVENDAPERAALRIVNLDHPEGEALLASFGPGEHAVGCALRPRQFAPGTIHRALRGYEMLSALKEIERAAAQPAVAVASAGESPASSSQKSGEPVRAAASVAASDHARGFQLAFWPEEFQDWPRDWWSILACLRSRRLSEAELIQELNLPQITVTRCLEKLQSLSAVVVTYDREAIAAAAPKRPERPWRKLGARLVGLLGGRS